MPTTCFLSLLSQKMPPTKKSAAGGKWRGAATKAVVGVTKTAEVEAAPSIASAVSELPQALADRPMAETIREMAALLASDAAPAAKGPGQDAFARATEAFLRLRREHQKEPPEVAEARREAFLGFRQGDDDGRAEGAVTPSAASELGLGPESALNSVAAVSDVWPVDDGSSVRSEARPSAPPPSLPQSQPSLTMLRRNVRALYEDARSHIAMERDAAAAVVEVQGKVAELQSAFRRLAEVSVEEIEGLRAEVDAHATELAQCRRFDARLRAVEQQVARLAQVQEQQTDTAAEVGRLARHAEERDRRNLLVEAQMREMRENAERERAGMQRALRALNAALASVEERQAHDDGALRGASGAISQLAARQSVLSDEVGILTDAMHEATIGGGGIIRPAAAANGPGHAPSAWDGGGGGGLGSAHGLGRARDSWPTGGPAWASGGASGGVSGGASGFDGSGARRSPPLAQKLSRAQRQLEEDEAAAYSDALFRARQAQMQQAIDEAAARRRVSDGGADDDPAARGGAPPPQSPADERARLFDFSVGLASADAPPRPPSWQ